MARRVVGDQRSPSHSSVGCLPFRMGSAEWASYNRHLCTFPAVDISVASVLLSIQTLYEFCRKRLVLPIAK